MLDLGANARPWFLLTAYMATVPGITVSAQAEPPDSSWQWRSAAETERRETGRRGTGILPVASPRNRSDTPVQAADLFNETKTFRNGNDPFGSGAVPFDRVIAEGLAETRNRPQSASLLRPGRSSTEPVPRPPMTVQVTAPSENTARQDPQGALTRPPDSGEAVQQIEGRDDGSIPASGSESADALEYQQRSMPEPLDLGGLVIRLAVATVGVLSLCVVSLWVAKRWLPNGPLSKTGSGRLKLLESLSLGQRCSVQLIQVDHQRLLVGLDASGMKSVVSLTDSFASTLSEIAESGEQSSENPQGSLGANEVSPQPNTPGAPLRSHLSHSSSPPNSREVVTPLRGQSLASDEPSSVAPALGVRL